MKHYIFLIALLISGSSLWAQINIGGVPRSWTAPLKGQVETISMPAIQLEKVKREDVEDEAKGLPMRFGYPMDAGFTMENSGTWTTLPEGGRIWRLAINAPGAKSINLLYDAFWLPSGATLYIYNEAKTHVIGGFTSRNNNSPRGQSIGYATGLVYGDNMMLEYYEPAIVDAPGELSISQVVYGYRHIRITNEKAYEDSDECHININCDEGDNWQFEKRAVALIVVGGSRICSGAMLNNTLVDYTPYFLTAHHCLGALDANTNPNASTWSFWWFYESPDCENPEDEPTNFVSTTGAILVANREATDFALFRLTEDPYLDAGQGMVYLGWTTSTTLSPNATGIHHPRGDVKKISFDDDAITSFGGNINWDNGVTTPPNTHWRIDFDRGGMQPGSSGSVIFDNNHRVIGQLHGGDTGSICDDQESFYGRLDVSWDAGNANRRLRDWLQPTCQNNIVITQNVTIGAPTFYASNTVTSNRLISGAVSYVVYNGGNEVILQDGFEVRGGANFRATNFDCNGAAPFQEEEVSRFADNAAPFADSRSTFEAPQPVEETVAKIKTEASVNYSRLPMNFEVYPNPMQAFATVQYELSEAAVVNLKLIDATGKTMLLIENGLYKEAGIYKIELESGQIPAGIYRCVLTTPSGVQTKQVVRM
jgi:hypothetical protein